MNPNAQFERDLEQWLQAEAPASAPADFHAAVIDRARTLHQRPGWTTSLPARWFGRGRGRGLTLLAAAALLLVGGAMAAGAGLLRMPSLVPPQPAPSSATIPTSSPAEESAGPTISPSPTRSETTRPGALIAFIRATDKAGAKCYDPNPTCPVPRVWIVGADGSGAHELFPGGVGEQGDVAWSPDGTRLVFSEAGTLYFTDASGSEPQVVDPGCVPPSCWGLSAAFSPDGTQLVFLRVHPHGGLAESWPIATMDLASGRVVELSSTAAVGPERPRWSPDGKQIVYSSLDKFKNGSAVFVVDADGKKVRQLSSATLPALLPDWSPDGSRIVFTSHVAKTVRVGGDNVMDLYDDVYTVRPDWTDLRRLTTDGFSSGATWTPDGRIMFTRQCTAKRPTANSDQADCSASGLWTIDADGNNARLLLPAGGAGAAWQPTP